MKKVSIVLLLLLSMVSVSAAQQSNSVDPSKLSVELQKRIIEEQNNKKMEEEKPKVLQQSEEWANIAKGLGSSVKELCIALNVELNSFIQTPAGKMLVFILIWKLFGATIVGLFLIMILLIITGISFRYFHTRKFRKLDDGTFEDISFEWDTSDASGKIFSVAFHVIIFVGSILVAITIL